jgi:hypothetical protein
MMDKGFALIFNILRAKWRCGAEDLPVFCFPVDAFRIVMREICFIVRKPDIPFRIFRLFDCKRDFP